MPRNPFDFSGDWTKYTDDDLSKMSFLELIELRDKYKSKEAQNRLAPYEHKAFVRYATEDNPLMGALFAGSAPIYAAGKYLMPNSLGARSDPSWNQIGQGILGFGEGMRNKLAQLVPNDSNSLSHQIGLKDKQKAFISKLRTVPREQQLQFMAEQLSTGIPDTEVKYQLPIELNEPEPLADMLYAQRKKIEKMSRRPL